MSGPRAGWRTFCCEECDLEWEEATRDALSPSRGDCPASGCSGTPQPTAYRLDPNLPVDRSGNLLMPMEERVRVSGEPVGYCLGCGMPPHQCLCSHEED